MPRKRSKITPPQLARQWGIAHDKVMAYIRSGELRAINAATPGRNQRPRFLIDLADLADFERRREVCPTPAPARRRRERLGTPSYY